MGAHHDARSTNCLPELTVCRARLVGAAVGGQAPEAERGVDGTEASPAADRGAPGIDTERSAAARSTLGSPRSVIAPHSPASPSGHTWPVWAHCKPACCARVHAAFAPFPAGYVPSGTHWARGERLADSGSARAGLYVLVIGPDLIASAHICTAVSDGSVEESLACQIGESGRYEINRGAAQGHVASIYAVDTCSG